MYRLYISNANYGATVHLLFSIQHVMALYSVSPMHRHTHTQKKDKLMSVHKVDTTQVSRDQGVLALIRMFGPVLDKLLKLGQALLEH